jgi:single-stranded DNA-binding protein
MAQFAQVEVRQGQRLYVEGRLEYNSYERDGITIPSAEIIVDEIVVLRPISKEE